MRGPRRDPGFHQAVPETMDAGRRSRKGGWHLPGTKAGTVITAVSLAGNWVKLIQARWIEKGPLSLLGMKARKVAGLGEDQIAGALAELARALPVAPRQVVGLVSTGEILTRYLTLPSDKPEELQGMALYQLEGVLPFPLSECVTSVKVLGAAGEATRVLVAAVHRPVVERLLRICTKAGLSLTSITASSEAIGQWHRACWPEAAGLAWPEAAGFAGPEAAGPEAAAGPKGLTPPWPGRAVPSRPEGAAPSWPAAAAAPSVWLVAELGREGVDLGILVQGNLVYMRQIPPVGDNLEELVSHLSETIQAYAREQVGPPVEGISLSGALEGFGPAALKQLELLLELPVRRVDPLERSPFREALSVTVQQVSPEVSFSELLGVACAPRLLELDLLPVETRWQQARQALFAQWRQTAVWVGVAACLLFGWIGTKMGGTWWLLRQTQDRMTLIRPQVDRIQGMAASVRAIGKARQIHAFQLDSLARSTRHLASEMTLQFLGLESDRSLTLRGTAPDLESVTRYATALKSEPLFSSVLLSSAKTHRKKKIPSAPTEEPQTDQETSHVEFEILIRLSR